LAKEEFNKKIWTIGTEQTVLEGKRVFEAFNFPRKKRRKFQVLRRKRFFEKKIALRID